jgi:hypothetical protein
VGAAALWELTEPLGTALALGEVEAKLWLADLVKEMVGLLGEVTAQRQQVELREAKHSRLLGSKKLFVVLRSFCRISRWS